MIECEYIINHKWRQPHYSSGSDTAVGSIPRRLIQRDGKRALNLDSPVGAVARQPNRDKPGGRVCFAHAIAEEPNGRNVASVLPRRDLFRFDALRVP